MHQVNCVFESDSLLLCAESVAMSSNTIVGRSLWCCYDIMMIVPMYNIARVLEIRSVIAQVQCN